MEEKLPKVSIVISTYNRAKYLPHTIESALAQDYLNLEVVVFDALSTDETQTVVARFRDKRLKYIRYKKKLAAHEAIQKAVYEHSTGDWLVIMSDDDYFLDSSYISNAMNLARKDETTILIHANYKYYFEKSDDYLEIRQQLPEIADGKWYFLNWGYEQRWWIEICLINKKLLEDIVLYDSEISTCDFGDLLRISLRGKVGFLNDVVAVYRVHENNANARASVARVIENFQCILIAYQYAKRKNLLPSRDLELWKRDKIKYLSDDMINNFAFKRNSPEMLRGIIRKLRKDYPFALIVLLYPKNMIKLVLFRFPRLFSQVLKIYQTLQYGKVKPQKVVTPDVSDRFLA